MTTARGDERTEFTVSGYIREFGSKCHQIDLPMDVVYLLVLFYDPYENICIIARFRPSNRRERRQEQIQDLEVNGPIFQSAQEIVMKRLDNNSSKQELNVTLDHILDTTTSQEEVFDTIGKPITQAIIDGYNATIDFLALTQL